MPSIARLTFESHILKDVKELIDTHNKTFGGKKGKPLSVFTRSATFLLCAAFELYVEEVLLEAGAHIINSVASPHALPNGMKETLADEVRQRAAAFALNLSGEGWRGVYADILKKKVESLNTPNAENIIGRMKGGIGIDVAPLLGPSSIRLGEFIGKRGDIAHQGIKAGHISISDVEQDYKFVLKLVCDLDNYLIEPLKGASGKRPWNKRA